MISSATLFLATLALHFTVVLGAPISIPVAEIAPRSLGDSGSSVRFARDESFPEVVPAFVKRAITDAFPVVKRETEDIVRRYPRRFIYDHLEKRGTTVQEKVTVFEKTIKHDSPADTVAYNNGQPQNNNNGNNDGATGGFTTSIGFSTTITVPGVPTPTPTSTSSSSAVPTPVPTGAPGPAPPAANGGPPDAPSTPSGTTTATDTGNTAIPTPAPPAANGGAPPTPATPSGTTTATDAGNTAVPTPDVPKPDVPKPEPPASPDGTTTTTTDGSPKPTDTTTTTTDGSTPGAPNPATPSPDGTSTTTTPTGEDPNATGGEQKLPTDGLVQPDTTTPPPTKRELAMSGAVLASSLRRRAL